MNSRFSCGLLILLLLFISINQAFAANDAKWQSWHDKMRGKHGVLRVDYQIKSDSVLNFKVYKNKDWNGNSNNWEKIDSFTITPKKTKHKKDFPKFYSSIIGDIVVHYEIDADFKNRKVHSKGYIKSPIPKTFPVKTQTQKWDQDFFSIPSPEKIIKTKKGDYEFVEVSEIWMGICSKIACGPWVQFPGYSETHRYNAYIPKVGPVIIQLWKGFCPSLGETAKNYDYLKGLVNLLNLGSDFPGGIGAEVGIYRPIGKTATMYDAATSQTPIGIGEWEPLVDPDLKISFQLVNPETGEVLVDAEEKNTWWRTKWMTAESFESYKQKHSVPAALKNFDFTKFLGKIPPSEVLNYELRYKINGVEQVPWKCSLFPGRYPEIGFNGIWRIRDWARFLLSPRVFEVLQIYNNGKELEFCLDDMKPVKIPLGKVAKGSDALGNFEVSFKPTGKTNERITLEFKYHKDEFDLKKELLTKTRSALPALKGKKEVTAKIDGATPELKQEELNFEHKIELEILLPSSSIAIHGIFSEPVIYDPL